MKIALCVSAALCAYLISGFNPAIIMSKAIFNKDIRTCGSGNPGFTNFKRTFGIKLALVVMALDLIKPAIPLAVFSCLFRLKFGDFSLGAAYTGFFCMIGHAYPVWYKFRGGKGFLVYMTVILFVDWRAWLVAAGILALIVFTIKYMSLASMCASSSSVTVLLFVSSNVYTILLCAAIVTFIIVRHRENIKRLVKGTESKFSFGHK